MKPPSDMRFLIRDLPESREFGLAEEFLRDALAAIPGQSELDTPELGVIDVSIEVTEEKHTVFARGTLAGRVHVACSRCLAPVELPVDEAFTLTFLPHADPDELEQDVELDDDDVDTTVHDGNEVDITDVLRDHVVLSVPYAPLCSEECKGLCAQCGTDLNHGQCECQPVKGDSPWAALENLKLK